MSLKISGDTKIHVLLRWADGFEDLKIKLTLLDVFKKEN